VSRRGLTASGASGKIPAMTTRRGHGQGIRDFVAAYEATFPGEVVHVAEPVSTDHDIMALVLEYERRRRWPVLLFEKVTGADMPIIANVVASRKALAWALGVPEARLAQEYARRIKDTIKPNVVARAPFRERLLTGRDLDLRRLPIPTYFPGDAGRYLTAGMLVARDPETGVETEGYHRFQLKGADRMGVSLHSRRRMFEYQRRAEARGEALPCAIALGMTAATIVTGNTCILKPSSDAPLTASVEAV